MPVPPSALHPAGGRGRMRTGRLVRLALAGTVALGLAGCTDGSAPSSTTTDAGDLPSADAAVVATALERETDLLGQAVELGLTDPVRVLTVHVAALASVGPAAASSVPAASPASPSDRPGPSLRQLRRDLAAAARQSWRDGAGVTDGAVAALLASVGASDEALAVALAGPPGSVPPVAGAFAAAAALPLGARPPAGTPPASPVAPPPDLVEAWQTALDGEHAAVYGYGLVGGRLPPGSTTARWGYDAHRARRDALTAALTSAGLDPVPAAPAYVPDRDVVTAADARRLATSIEQDSLAPYAGLVAAGDPPWRTVGTLWLRAATLTLLGWSGQVAALPGMTPPVVASDLPSTTSGVTTGTAPPTP